MSTAVKESPRAHDRLFAALLIFALAVASAIPLIALYHALRAQPDRAPDFTLIDQDAQPFTLSSLRGHPVALFFGYTHCPDACPTTLAKLTRAIHSPEAPPGIRVVFVTVDRARDTPVVLKRYVRLFDPAIVGLTGSQQALDPVYAAYHAWYSAVPVNHGRSDYSVAHGTRIYYVARDGSMKGFGDYTDAPAQIIHAFKEYQ
jgi:protein SCO1/2